MHGHYEPDGFHLYDLFPSAVPWKTTRIHFPTLADDPSSSRADDGNKICELDSIQMRGIQPDHYVSCDGFLVPFHWLFFAESGILRCGLENPLYHARLLCMVLFYAQTTCVRFRLAI